MTIIRNTRELGHHPVKESATTAFDSAGTSVLGVPSKTGLDQESLKRGAGGGVAVSKVLAALHPERPEDAPAFVAARDGMCCPTKYLVSRSRRWAGRRLLRAPRRFAFGSPRARHVHAPRAPAGVDAESRGVADGQRRRFGDPLLDIRARRELWGQMERLGRGERQRAGGRSVRAGTRSRGVRPRSPG